MAEENAKSYSHVPNDGSILKSIMQGKEVVCPTCHGKGTINDPKLFGQLISYCDQDGNGVPQVICRTCGGEGWVISQ